MKEAGGLDGARLVTEDRPVDGIDLFVLLAAHGFANRATSAGGGTKLGITGP